jgi:hypothetical protein
LFPNIAKKAQFNKDPLLFSKGTTEVERDQYPVQVMAPLGPKGPVGDPIAPGLLKELRVRSPKGDKGYRDPMHLWLSEDVGDPMLAQHLYTLMMFQRLAIANGHGWNRFLHTVDQVLPRRGDTLPLPFEDAPQIGNDEAAN